MQAKKERLELLLRMLTPVPEEWVKKAGTKSSGGEVRCEPCDTYKKLINSWRKALKWTPGLDNALSVMLSSITSTMSVGDQLWIKIIGPASCGKSTLCEAVSVNTKYVLAKSTIRGFHSGFGDGQEDHSLISKVSGKTLVTKDGDTLLQSPNLGQILSEARDVYDTVSRTSYRNKSSRDYQGIRMTWLLCGTSSLRSIDSSELGERFLDCVIMEGIDEDLEDEILWRVVNKSIKNMGIEADGTPESQQSPEMTEAMSLTGGYIDFLRNQTQRKLEAIIVPDWALHKCMKLGKFVSLLRARPSRMQEETAEREFAARLVSQLTRLMMCLSLVLNRKTIDKEVLKRTVKVAMDTSRGNTLLLVKELYERGQLSIPLLATYTGLTDTEVRKLLKFLRKINVVAFTAVKLNGVVNRSKKPQWQLTSMMRKLYESVCHLEKDL